MKKRVLSVILAVVLVLAGCGSSVESGEGKQSQAVDEREVTIVPEKETKETVVVGEVFQEQEEEKESAAASEAGKEASGESKKQDTPKKTDASKKPGTASKGSQVNGNQANSGKVDGDQAETGKTPHTCTFDGGKVTAAASCNSAGTKTFTCTKCGAIKTESIPKTSHNYVTETKGATCTEEGYTKTYCSNCGDVQSQTSSGNPTGHNYQKSYWPSAPTCSSSGYYNLICTTCGANGGDGTDAALPHTPVTREEAHATYCNENGVIVTECSVCGAELERHGYSGTEHEWKKGSDQVWDAGKHEFVSVETTYCNRCGIHQ